ncbi:MAG: hypothetical protein Q8Q89_04205 [bacterium]|nr:hypothetical protein [bacterium]
MNSQEITDYQYFLASPFFAELVDFDAPDTKVFIQSFCALSLPLRDFLSSPDVAAVIVSLGEKYGLQEKQISTLSRIIKDLVFGKVFIKDLPSNISSGLGIDETKASQLVNELASQSFGPVLEDIKRIQRAKFPERIAQMKSTPQPTPVQTAPRPISLQQPPPRPEFKMPPLEDELEKVASIIDLRNKPKE